MSRFAFLLVFVLLGILSCTSFSAPQPSDDPTYDHQTTTYNANHAPVSTTQSVSLTPFFSPDHSVDTLTEIIEGATEYLDIETPGWDSWSNCTSFYGCSGCTVAFMYQSEAFPMWRALVNAIHRGVSVRIVTNDYDSSDCAGVISPLSYLVLAGASIRYYTTTTFMHAKYVSADKGKKTATSSVNFSFTSFMKNREAGMVIDGTTPGGAVLNAYLASIFEFDYNQGFEYQVNQTYTNQEMTMIHSTVPLSVNIPTPLNFPCTTASVNPTPITVSGGRVTVMTAPDYAHDTYVSLLNSATSSVVVAIYQITDWTLCDTLVTLAKKGVKIQIFVSSAIVSDGDYKTAQECYSHLYYNGIVVYKSHPKCLSYSHQKYWIIDNEVVAVSTGNWSPSDMPDGSQNFVPFGTSGWRVANRDYTVIIEGSSQMVNVFAGIFKEDYSQGYAYKPEEN